MWTLSNVMFSVGTGIAAGVIYYALGWVYDVAVATVGWIADRIRAGA